MILRVSKSDASSSSNHPLLLSFPQSLSTESADTVVPIRCSALMQSGGKRKKTVVSTDLNGLTVSGRNYDEIGGDIYKNDTCYFAVGSINEKTGEITLRSTDHAYVMKPEIESNNAISRSFASNYERKQVLTEEFGSKKKKRAMQAAQSNYISEENIAGAKAVEQSMIATYESANFDKTNVSAAEVALEKSRLESHPKHNAETEKLVDAYPLFGVFPTYIAAGLDEYVAKLELTTETDSSGASSLRLLKSKLEQANSSSNSSTESVVVGGSNVFSTICNMIESSNSVHKSPVNIKIIIFTNYLLKFLVAVNSSNDKMVLKSDLATISDASEQINMYIADNFTTFRKFNGKPSYTASKTLIDKFFMHIIVLVLHSCNFQCSISSLAQDTKLTDSTLSSIARALGCNIIKKPSDRFPGGDVTAVLTAPLKFPKSKKVKK